MNVWDQELLTRALWHFGCDKALQENLCDEVIFKKSSKFSEVFFN